MVLIRCTMRLLERIGPPTDNPGPSTTRLGDWYANLIAVGSQRFVLAVSEHGRLPILLRGRDLKHLAAHLPIALGDVLQALGVPRDRIAAELDQMKEFAIAATANRSLVASMNDYGQSIKWQLRDKPSVDALQQSLSLARTPILVLDGESPDIMVPRLFDVERRPPPQQALQHPERSMRTEQPSKSLKRLLREWAGIAHERELGRALGDLRRQFDEWQAGGLTAFDLNERIHRFHDDTSREIWVRYSQNPFDVSVAFAVVNGIIRRDELPGELVEHLATLIESYQAIVRE